MDLPDRGTVRVGIVGDLKLTSSQEQTTKKYIDQLMKLINRDISQNQSIEIVSQHVYAGVPRIAYKKASQKEYSTLGISCKKASKYPRYEVDISHVVGNTWHETIQTLLNNVHILIVIGDENLSEQFYQEARKRFFQVFRCRFKDHEQQIASNPQQKACCDD